LNTAQELKLFASYFKGNSIVIFPTDTVIGIGCRYDSAQAISKIRQIKGIVDKTPLAVLISNEAQLDTLKVRRSSISNLLMQKFWPGALTLVLTSENVYPCSGEANSIGIRMPDSELLRKMIEVVGVPLAATSANFHGRPAPATLDAIDEPFRKMVDHIIDLDVKPIGQASTVVKVEGGSLRVYREGAVTKDEICQAVGAII
jgi:L-threonylcarbamoyladenylate synthase